MDRFAKRQRIKTDSHLQNEDLIFCSLPNFPAILFQELFASVHFQCVLILGPEDLTELLSEEKGKSAHSELSYYYSFILLAMIIVSL